MFGVALDAVTSDMRRSAKTINFGLIYGMSAFGLAKQLGIGRAGAEVHGSLLRALSGVLEYMERPASGRTPRAMSKPVWSPPLSAGYQVARNAGLRKAAERAAINAPMQGTAPTSSSAP